MAPQLVRHPVYYRQHPVTYTLIILKLKIIKSKNLGRNFFPSIPDKNFEIKMIAILLFFLFDSSYYNDKTDTYTGGSF